MLKGRVLNLLCEKKIKYLVVSLKVVNCKKVIKITAKTVDEVKILLVIKVGSLAKISNQPKY